MTALQHIAIEAEAAVQIRVRHVLGPRERAKVLHQVIRNNDNEDATSRAYALEALEDGRAAFWVAREGSQNATAGCIQRTACRLGSLGLAIEEEVPDFIARAHPDRIETALDLLIPLNSAAVVQLMDAYEDADTFRDRDELIARRGRVSPLVKETV